jgi:hypothetical protein
MLWELSSILDQRKSVGSAPAINAAFNANWY